MLLDLDYNKWCVDVIDPFQPLSLNKEDSMYERTSYHSYDVLLGNYC